MGWNSMEMSILLELEVGNTRRENNQTSVDSMSDNTLPSLTQTDILKADLEFVQNLCNASYLQFLAQNKYFEEKEFMNYLSYLRYWNEPEYKQLLFFPQCLEILDNLLVNDAFRKELLIPQFVAYFHQQQGSFWMLDKSVTKIVDASEASSILAQNIENTEKKG